jgi:hypothetical protein
MPYIIQIKRSTEANKIPTSTDLVVGELGVNLIDKKLYCGDGNTVFPLNSKDESLIIPLGSVNSNATLLVDEPLLGRYFPFTGTIQSILLTLKTAPTGSSFIVDIKKNTTSILSTPLSISSGNTISNFASLNTTLITIGDLITFSVVQIGAITTGVYPVVLININRSN